MTFTYAMPPVTPLARVRLELGDTVTARALFQDEEIQVKLDARGTNELLAAADLCDILATRLARDFDFKWKDGQFNRSQAAKMYADRAVELRKRGAGIGVIGTTRVDGYSDDISSRDGSGQTSKGGRIRIGYTDPDLPV